MVTVKLQFALFLLASDTVQVTVVTPFWNVEPDGGVQLGVPTPGQLSVAVAFAYVTTREQAPVVVVMEMFAGQLRLGGVVSLTVTVNEQLAGLPAASLTEQLTVVVPLGKTEPLAGLHFGVATPEQLSLTVGGI